MGFLGWELGLSLKQNILVIVFGSIAGASITVSFLWVEMQEIHQVNRW